MDKTMDKIENAVYQRLLANITKYVSNPQVIFPSGNCIPQRPYCQGTPIPDGAAGQRIMFAMADDGGVIVFTHNHTINLRIEWPGYDGWGAQIRTVNYQEEPKGITRAKLVTEIAKQLKKFIEKMAPAAVDPAYASYKVGPGAIELRHIHIASLEQVSRGSWQPRFIYSES